MVEVKKPIVEFSELREREKKVTAFVAGLERMTRELSSPFRGTTRVDDATRGLGDVIAQSKQWANIMGRRRLWLEVNQKMRVHGVTRGEAFASKAQRLAKVEFVEATEDIASRLPIPIPEQEQAFLQVQEIYSTEHGFALAKSAEQSLTVRVQGILREALRTGRPLPSAEKVIAALGSWTRAYAATVFRTNLSSAYAAGRFQQALSPELDDFIVGMRRVPVGDKDTRPNHNFRLTAAKRDPIWLELGVPGGYNCRCSMQMIDQFDPEAPAIPSRAVAPPGAFNDRGFERRAGFEVFGLEA